MYERHFRRRSFEPITSYGIIAYMRNKSTNLYLLYQRRDNFEYMDFLRGIWTDKDHATRLIALMSNEERDRLKNYTFDELWSDLWIDHECRIYQDSMKARKKYNSIKSTLFSLLNNSYQDNTPPWGFPKGKKNKGESTLTCAQREFQEETGIPFSKVAIDTARTFTERFQGTNGKVYSTEYFIGRLDEFVQSREIETPQCIRKRTLTDEARAIGWFTFDEAIKRLAPCRKEILTRVDTILRYSE